MRRMISSRLLFVVCAYAYASLVCLDRVHAHTITNAKTNTNDAGGVSRRCICRKGNERNERAACIRIGKDGMVKDPDSHDVVNLGCSNGNRKNMFYYTTLYSCPVTSACYSGCNVFDRDDFLPNYDVMNNSFACVTLEAVTVYERERANEAYEEEIKRQKERVFGFSKWFISWLLYAWSRLPDEMRFIIIVVLIVYYRTKMISLVYNGFCMMRGLFANLSQLTCVVNEIHIPRMFSDFMSTCRIMWTRLVAAQPAAHSDNKNKLESENYLHNGSERESESDDPSYSPDQDEDDEETSSCPSYSGSLSNDDDESRGCLLAGLEIYGSLSHSEKRKEKR